MESIYIKWKRVVLIMLSLMLFSWQISYSAGAIHVIKKELPRSGKTSAPISVSYSVPATNAINDKVKVIITVKPLSDVGGLTLKLTAGEGLAMPTEEFNKNYGDQLRNAVFSETVTVTPSTDGILYLNVFVSGTFNGKQMTRSGAVPIKVGAATQKMLKKSGQAATDSKGQKIIIMPAEEKAK